MIDMFKKKSMTKSMAGALLFAAGFVGLCFSLYSLYDFLKSGADMPDLMFVAGLVGTPLLFFFARSLMTGGRLVELEHVEGSIGLLIFAVPIVAFTMCGFYLIKAQITPDHFMIFVLVIVIFTPAAFRVIYESNEDFLRIPAAYFGVVSILFMAGLFINEIFTKDLDVYFYIMDFVYVLMGFGLYRELNRASKLDDNLFDFLF